MRLHTTKTYTIVCAIAPFLIRIYFRRLSGKDSLFRGQALLLSQAALSMVRCIYDRTTLSPSTHINKSSDAQNVRTWNALRAKGERQQVINDSFKSHVKHYKCPFPPFFVFFVFFSSSFACLSSVVSSPLSSLTAHRILHTVTDGAQCILKIVTVDHFLHFSLRHVFFLFFSPSS